MKNQSFDTNERIDHLLIRRKHPIWGFFGHDSGTVRLQDRLQVVDFWDNFGGRSEPPVLTVSNCEHQLHISNRIAPPGGDAPEETFRLVFNFTICSPEVMIGPQLLHVFESFSCDREKLLAVLEAIEEVPPATWAKYLISRHDTRRPHPRHDENSEHDERDIWSEESEDAFRKYLGALEDYVNGDINAVVGYQRYLSTGTRRFYGGCMPADLVTEGDGSDLTILRGKQTMIAGANSLRIPRRLAQRPTATV